MSLIAELGIEIPETDTNGRGRNPERVLAYLVALAIECRGQGAGALGLPELFPLILRDFPNCQEAVDKIREECAGQLIYGVGALRDAWTDRRPDTTP
jgi:hypothetical protein